MKSPIQSRRLPASLLLLGCSLLAGGIHSSHGQSTAVSGGEYFFDADPGQGLGRAIPAPAAVTDASPFTVPASVVGGLSAGVHSFSVRWRDGADILGGAATVWMYRLPADEFTATTLAELEYFIDADPGAGAGTAVTIPSGNTTLLKAFSIPAATLSLTPEGVHTLNVRYRDGKGVWSAPSTTLFVKAAEDFGVTSLVAAETFFDADPGQGSGEAHPIAGSPATQSGVIPISSAVTQALSTGVHTLNIRYLDSKGSWSAPTTTLVVKTSETGAMLRLVRMEWEWWSGSDSAVRQAGAPVLLTPALAAGEAQIYIPGNQLTAGQTVTVRSWWVAEDGTTGIPSQKSYVIEAHATAWNQFYFTPAEISNSEISGPTADPDGDGASNLLELALGSNPQQSDGAGLTIPEDGSAPMAGFSLAFDRLAGGSTNGLGLYTAGKYSYQIEELVFSGNGTPLWSTVPPQEYVLQLTAQSANPSFERASVTLSFQADTSRRLVRLIVKQLP